MPEDGMRYTLHRDSFPSIGHCIYCRSTEQLTDEHIIPYSLGGEFVFKNASCKKCSDITSGVELLCARGLYGAMRALHKYPTRRKKDLPTHFELELECNGKTELRKVPFDELPSIPVIAPIFPRAGLLAGHAPNNEIPGIQYKMVLPIVEGHEEKLQELRGDGPTQVRLSGPWGLNPFMRLLAKIAHGLAVAGDSDYTPLLPDYILDRDTRLSHVIGTVNEPITAPPEQISERDASSAGHAFTVGVHTQAGKHYVAVRPQLFRYLDLPVYEIIAGADPSAALLERVFAKRK